MSVTDPTATLGDLVLAHPAAAVLFERLNLDYCCGGRRSLEEACSQRGLDAQTVTVMLDALRDGPGVPAVHQHDVGHREPVDLQRLFARLRADLEIHLRREEHILFPACRVLDEHGEASGFDAAVVALLEDDHETTGDALSALRELCGGYDAERALCGTHRTLLRSLRALELDLHQHVHEENNVLFPRVRERIAAAT